MPKVKVETLIHGPNFQCWIDRQLDLASVAMLRTGARDACHACSGTVAERIYDAVVPVA